jgi:hypothetical protein
MAKTTKEELEQPGVEEAFVKELEALAAKGFKMHVELNAHLAFALLSQLQLALRHPDNHGMIIDQIILPFVKNMAAKLGAGGPTMAKVCEAGFDPSCDFMIVPKEDAYAQEEETVADDRRRDRRGGVGRTRDEQGQGPPRPGSGPWHTSGNWPY